jgi:CubicO group peptidase (beta-lactamase class C family)
MHSPHGKFVLLTRSLVVALGLAIGGGALAQTNAAHAVEAAPTPAAAVVALPAQLQDFDAYVEAVRAKFEVPGIAVAIVKDGQVVLARGYGLRDRERNLPVDAHTLFAIASNTKAFTAASLSMLADDGKLELDDRVTEHLPWFRMSDPFVTREMRIRDLLAHRSGLGLGAGDLLYWPGTDYSTEEVARRLRDVPLDGSFRARYAYDNILYGVAQLVIEQASGQPYDEFLRTRIFAPLGMDETRFNSDALLPGDGNVATGYAKADFKDPAGAADGVGQCVGRRRGLFERARPGPMGAGAARRRRARARPGRREGRAAAVQCQAAEVDVDRADADPGR